MCVKNLFSISLLQIAAYKHKELQMKMDDLKNSIKFID